MPVHVSLAEADGCLQEGPHGLSDLGGRGISSRPVRSWPTRWGRHRPVGCVEEATKSLVVYSTAMTRNGPELPGFGRSRRTTNHLVTQQKIRNNRTYPDLCVANPLVPGSGPPAPHQRHKRGCTARVWNG